MLRKVVPLAVLLMWLAPAGWGVAQPALEKLEQMLREQAGPGEAPPAAAAKPGGAEVGKGEAAPRQPGYLGVVADDAEDRGLGVRVLDVLPGTPAEKAGLKSQDLITAVAGTRVRSMEDLAGVIAKLPAGRTVDVEIVRGEQEQRISVTLGRRPPMPPPPQPAEPAGSERALLEQLLRRIEALERRVEALERALSQKR